MSRVNIDLPTETELTDTVLFSPSDPTTRSISLKATLLKLRQLLGENRVLDDETSISSYSRTTIAATIRPRAIIKPVKRQQVQSIVEICAAAVRLYPIDRRGPSRVLFVGS